jgi:protein-tyrosine phosphatase
VTPRPVLDDDLLDRAPGIDAALARQLPFRFMFNVRDLGGMRTGDGRGVRHRHLFRADGVHRLAGDDLELARSLRLRTVLDLRTDEEIERGRFPVDEYPVDWHHLPILRRIWSEDDLVATDGAARFLADRYLDMLESGAVSLARAVELLAGGAPALFHCAAGKDRTGVVAAVVLGLLGVPEDEIADDYHQSAQNMAAFREWIVTEFPEAASAMTDQPPEYLEAPVEAMVWFLEGVESRHGSMAGLADDLGVPDEAVARLRATLLEG